MSYEDRIKAFWTMAEEKQLSSLARLLGLGMLELWRRRGFTAGCGLSNYELANLIGTNEKTVRRLRTELIDAGFIWCSSKKGNLPVFYFDKELVPEELINSKPKEKPRPRPRPRPKAQEQNLFTAKELGKTDKANEERKKRKKKEFTPPTLEECIAAFVQKGSTEAEARLFFDYFNSQDWYKSNGKVRVTNVDSAINYWINRKKDERSGDIRQGVSHREKRNNDLKAELLARYGQI